MQFSIVNFLETLVIIAFCSFAIGLYWRFKFRSKYLAMELEETRLLNEELKEMQEKSLESMSSGHATVDTNVNSEVGSGDISAFPSRAATWLKSRMRLSVEKVGLIVLVVSFLHSQITNDYGHQPQREGQ
jgi:hypothetical protein